MLVSDDQVDTSSDASVAINNSTISEILCSYHAHYHQKYRRALVWEFGMAREFHSTSVI